MSKVIVVETEDQETVRRVKAAAKPRCEVADCERPQTSRGLCTMHYARARKVAEMPEGDREGDPKVLAVAESLAAEHAGGQGPPEEAGEEKGRGFLSRSG